MSSCFCLQSNYRWADKCVKTNKTEPKKRIGAKFLTKISPRHFEELIANLYEKMGYHVKSTPQTRDQGIDVYAKCISESGTESLAIQCKHYQNGVVVGVDHVRSLYGVIQNQPSITRGVLITSGNFSRECKEFARGKRIELFDSKYLSRFWKRQWNSAYCIS